MFGKGRKVERIEERDDVRMQGAKDEIQRREEEEGFEEKHRGMW